jgi:GTP-binding protein LepA
MVFASFYPQNPDEFDLLKDSLAKLKLNDPSLTFEPETKEGLGRGFRCGFLGTLHAEIISERIMREHKLKLIISSPSVLYKIVDNKNKELLLKSATDWPEASQIKEIQEPWVKLSVITPQTYLGKILELLRKFEAKKTESRYFGENKVILDYEAPFRAIIAGFYDKLKSISQGFSSMNYEFLEYKAADLVKLEILIAGRKEEAFSKIVARKDAFEAGKNMVEKLKESLPPQLFSVALQAAVGGKIVARETIRARGKDVIAPLYGGDYTRKRKLLERQKKGKRELKEKGRIVIPPNVFFEVFKS